MAPKDGKKDITPPPSYAESEMNPDLKSHLGSTALSDLTGDAISEKSFHNDAWDNRSENWIYRIQDSTTSCFSSYSILIGRAIAILFFVGYGVYLGFAINYDFDKSIAVIVLTSVTVFFIIYGYIRDHYGDAIYNKLIEPATSCFSKYWYILKWIIIPGLMIALVLYLSLAVVKEIKQLQSLSGFVLFILLTYITSKYPDRINWRPVIWGYSLQLLLAILVLRWEYGYIAVKFLADEITKFIEYGYDGAAQVFGDPALLLHAFVFMAMPLLIYIGAVMSILYYYGITQMCAVKVAWLMQKTMQTTAIETLSVASNIFLNGMDSMLMLRHYLARLTRSEFNCLLVGNHATVAGFAFAIFVMFGAPPQHLLSAAVMSAPATFAIAKLNFPETEESVTKSMEDVKLDKGEETNVFEAAANGSAVAGKTAVAVVVNFVSFLSILTFINATLSYMGGRVGFPQLSFELICSYLFWPLALIIGIDVSECQEVAKLLGIKIFTSEILAYQELGRSAAAGLLNARSQAIATYALCGFSSLSTLAIAVGVWNSICPQKVGQMASSMFRVIIEANVSCFMTACVAGLFYTEDMRIFQEQAPPSPIGDLIGWILGLIPSFRDLMNLAF